MSQAVIANNKSISVAKRTTAFSVAQGSGINNHDLYTTTSQEYLEIEYLNFVATFTPTWSFTIKIIDNNLGIEIASVLASSNVSYTYSYFNECFQDFFHNATGGLTDQFVTHVPRLKVPPNCTLRLAYFQASASGTLTARFSATSFINSP